QKDRIGTKGRVGALSSTAAAGALLLALTAASPQAVGQACDKTPAGSMQICPSVKGASCNIEPAASTPIPKQFQASYNVYLKMKAAAHGGTHYGRGDYAKMHDWSGIWTRGAAP